MSILPSPEKFYLKTSLYEEFKIDDDNYKDLIRIEFYRGTLDTFCTRCERDSVFISTVRSPEVYVGSSIYEPDSIDHLLRSFKSALFPTSEGSSLNQIDVLDYAYQDRSKSVMFECSRDHNHDLQFVFRVRDRVFQKIGQYPSIADLERSDLARFQPVLDEEKQRELRRAMGLYAHGVGIGAFVYLRRIFEYLIESAAERASASTPEWDEVQFRSARMDEKIRMLRDHLPEYLVKNSHVYSIRSSGVHSLSEDFCVTHFVPVKLAIELMLDERVDAIRKEEKERQTRDALAKIGIEIRR